MQFANENCTVAHCQFCIACFNNNEKYDAKT